LSRIEVNGRFRQDAAPMFPLPLHIIAPKSRLRFETTNVLSLSNEEVFGCLEESPATNYVHQQLGRLNALVDQEASARDLWKDDLFAVYNISPLLHEALSFARGLVRDDLHLRQRECFRLASLLYLCNLRAKFDFEPGVGMLYGTKLLMILESPGMLPRWNRSNIFLLWSLTVAACSETLFDDIRTRFVILIAEIIGPAQMSSFQEYHDLICSFLWSKAAFETELSALEGQVTFNRQREETVEGW
jgi:hypothetical protein